MKSKAFLIVLLFLTWSLSSGWYYVCKIKEKCPSSTSIAKIELPAFTFEHGVSSPKVNPSFDDFKSRTMERLGETDVLIIVGLYDPTELNSTDFDNLGMARANAVVQTLSDIDPSRIVLSSKEISFGEDIEFLDAIKFNIRIKNQFVEETDLGAFLYFDENVSVDALPVKLEVYLQFMAIHEKGKAINIIGHTYNAVANGDNYELGLERANMVREILIAKGLNPNNITVSSQVQTEPLADYITESGIRTNRRVEILINE
ncbi:OmpA family protein [Bacteroidia bacterium]|jgi:hypothetical protein|nr:OmpA family protein [Bacteroidia bacterium]